MVGMSLDTLPLMAQMKNVMLENTIKTSQSIIGGCINDNLVKRQFKQFNNSDNINKMNNISAQVIEHSKDDDK
jgi:hypothetical protein